MMIPIPGPGTLRRVDGIDLAAAVPGVTDIRIELRPGDSVVPLPEGATYLGFIFAEGETPGDVERALRSAHACLRIDIAPVGQTGSSNGYNGAV
jgi:hypothetical protein